MKTIAVLPVKSFVEAKRRLRHQLTSAARRALAEAMFFDVLLALRRASLVDGILVVSADHGAQRIAGGYGAKVVEDDERGHNTAASLGILSARESGSERVLLVPGDCPALDPAELDGLLGRAAASPSALIVPDRHGTGTNALLLTPPDALAPAFGPNSRKRHIAQAESKGLAHEVVEVPSLALDVDTPGDLAALQTTLAGMHGGAAHTRGLLSQLMRSRA